MLESCERASSALSPPRIVAYECRDPGWKASVLCSQIRLHVGWHTIRIGAAIHLVGTKIERLLEIYEVGLAGVQGAPHVQFAGLVRENVANGDRTFTWPVQIWTIINLKKTIVLPKVFNSDRDPSQLPIAAVVKRKKDVIIRSAATELAR
jgi:hypothetical protein